MNKLESGWAKPMHIDIVSDTVCPWCFIGKRKLENALSTRPDVKAEITWRPFQLNPEMPAEGMDRASYLQAKFGGSERAEQIYVTVAEAGESAGIPFAFDLIQRTPSTINSHRLIRWAESAGVQNQVVEALFRRYFLEGADIADHEVLIAAAAEAGMDTTLVADLLARGVDVDLIRREDTNARQMGINGVPCFIIDRKYAISGAQDAPVFHKVFDLALKESVETEDAAV
jgi:predicted DsbA family dithiol-disulfide isomerase